MLIENTYELGREGKLIPLVSKFNDLKPGAVIKWGGNMAWAPTRYCILSRMEGHGVMYDCYDLDHPEKNSRLHRVEASSIKAENDAEVWHSQHYFLQDETIEDVVWLRQDHAHQKEEAEKHSAQVGAENNRLEALGRELWPALLGDCPAVIVAEKHHNDSDIMTDYFSSSVTGRVILAASSHKRDIFSEMRKAAALIPETANLATPPDANNNGEKLTEDNKAWWHPADEHREKYSMGAGYYLSAEGSYSGWHVSKDILWKGGPRREDYICLAIRHDHLKKDGKESKAKSETAGSVTFSVTHERDWTWITFDQKPPEDVRETLKNKYSARFSGKRQAWYICEHIEEITL